MMKPYCLIAPALVLALLSACGGGGASAPNAASSAPEPPAAQSSAPSGAAYQTISAEDAKAMMDDGAPYILLDVRTQEEFDEGHIDGALLLPYDEIAGLAETELPDEDARILLYCRTGRRSAIAAETLAGMGYTDVYDFGGIVDWPYQTVQ